jgi:hypothetical protein
MPPAPALRPALTLRSRRDPCGQGERAVPPAATLPSGAPTPEGWRTSASAAPVNGWPGG